MTIDWTNPAAQVTAHFTVKDACWLPSWHKLHSPTPDEQANLIKTCLLMERIRGLFNKPINVHVMIRPTDYNKEIGGAPHSAHVLGLACDFDVSGIDCDAVRAVLHEKLDLWSFRVENKPYSNWVHADLAEVLPGGHRYFTP